jgi:opacity protein-like surface antigen
MRRRLQLGFLIFSLSLGMHLHAQDRTGPYFGASVGEGTNEVGEFKGSDTAFKVNGGYSFNEYLSIELAYVDAGTQTDTVGAQRIENESSGVIASALLSLPLSEWIAVFGKLGYAFYDSEATGRVGDVVIRENDGGEDFAYGFGVEIAVPGGLGLRAEYETVDVNEGDFDILSAGVIFRF